VNGYQKVIPDKNVYSKGHKSSGLFNKIGYMQNQKKVVIIFIQFWSFNNAQAVFYIKRMKVKMIPQELHIFFAWVLDISPDKIFYVINI
jgi:hypothetical protein